MKRLLSAIIIMICVFRLTAADGSLRLEPELRQKMSVADRQEMIKVNIILKKQYDQFEMRKKANAFFSKEAKRDFVVSELKRFSDESQKAFLESLPTASRSAQLTDIHVHWLVNAINCFATVEILEEMSLHPDVLTIGLDELKYCLIDGDATPLEEPTSDIMSNVTKINAHLVWETGNTGEGVVVAVIDTGVNYNHEDIAANMWEHPDFPNHGYNAYFDNHITMDQMGHGSHCAGTVAGTGTSGKQTGVAPGATIMAVTVMNANGKSSASIMVKGIEFAVEHGAQVLSMSFGIAQSSSHERIMLRNTMVNVLEAGVPACVACGNEGEITGRYPIPNNVRVPGSCPPPWLHPDQTITGGLSSVISIGATQLSDAPASFSSQGPVTWQNIEGFEDYAYAPGIGLIRPDVCAPGVSIVSLSHTNTKGYSVQSGTSMATPAVAGVVALMLHKNPYLTPAEICEILETTSEKLTEKKSTRTGSGRVDALAAVNAVTAPPMTIESFSINDKAGNNNGKLNPTETAFINLSLKNTTDSILKEVAVELSTTSQSVSILNNRAELGDVAIDEVKTITDIFDVTVSENALVGEKIIFSLTLIINNEAYPATILLEVYDFRIELLGFSVDPEAKGKIKPGENALVSVYIKNTGNEEVPDLFGTLSSVSPYLTVDEQKQSYGRLLPEQYKQRTFKITVKEDTPGSVEFFPIALQVQNSLGRSATLAFTYDNEEDNSNIPVPCDNPSGLTTSVNGSDISLTWTSPSEASPETYFVYQNGLYIDETAATTFVHENAGGGKHTYCIEAVYEDGCTSDAQCIVSNPIACPPPTGLAAKTIAEDAITISWEAPQEKGLRYNLYSGTELIAENIPDTSYTHTGLEHGANYCYTVVSVCPGEMESEKSAEYCIDCVGIDNMAVDHVKIYPNPANNTLFIEGEHLKQVAIYNLLGQLMDEFAIDGIKTTIHTASYSPNVYILKITSGNGISINKRIVVSH